MMMNYPMESDNPQSDQNYLMESDGPVDSRLGRCPSPVAAAARGFPIDLFNHFFVVGFYFLLLARFSACL